MALAPKALPVTALKPLKKPRNPCIMATYVVDVDLVHGVVKATIKADVLEKLRSIGLDASLGDVDCIGA